MNTGTDAYEDLIVTETVNDQLFMFLQSYTQDDPVELTKANQLIEPWFECELVVNPITETDFVYIHETEDKDPYFELIQGGGALTDKTSSKCIGEKMIESLVIRSEVGWLADETQVTFSTLTDMETCMANVYSDRVFDKEVCLSIIFRNLVRENILTDDDTKELTLSLPNDNPDYYG